MSTRLEGPASIRRFSAWNWLEEFHPEVDENRREVFAMEYARSTVQGVKKFWLQYLEEEEI